MKIKKVICILLSLTVIFGCVSVSINATSGLKNDLTVYDKNSGNLTFEQNYAKVGETLTVLVDGKENDKLFYEWFIDNKKIENTSNCYTPVKSDMQSMISVKAYSLPSGNFVGNVNMLVSSLPVVYVETQNRQAVVSKEVQLNSHLYIQGNDFFSDSDVLYDGDATIKGRGNSTWLDSKKPYKIKLDSKADILGMGKNKHWVLLSNPADNSFSRNTLSYNLAGEMGINYQQLAPVDLVLNGSYVGSYSLCEHVRVGETRVDVTDWDDIAEDAAKAIYKANTDKMTKAQRDELIDIMTDESKQWVDTDEITFNSVTYTVSDYYEIPDINGGYILGIDVYDGTYKSTHGSNVYVDRPEVYSDKMYEEIIGYYQAFEDALFSDDYCTEYNGKTVRYTDLIDVESFAKGCLINELFMNRDFGTNSTYFYKEIDGKLFYGPLWDMDFTSDRYEGNFSFDYDKWQSPKVDFIGRLYSDPYFLSVLYDTYWLYRYTSIADIIKVGGKLDENYELIKNSAYADEKIWNYSNSFDNEYERLTQWLNRRIETFDSFFSSLKQLHNSTKQYSSNNFNSSSSLSLSVNGDVLNLNSTEDAVSSYKIYKNGILAASFKSSNSVMNYYLPNNTNSLITVIGYDENGEIVCGNFISTKKAVTSLSVKALPDKLTYNVGDTLDLTGLELEATFSDGSAKLVSPQAAITYAKDAVGAQFFDNYNIVTDTYGEEIYVSLRYDNLKTEFKIELNKRNNIDEVEALIDAFPSESLNESYYKEIVNAALAFEALSDESKLQVKNKEKLDKVMGFIDESVESSGVGVVACFMQQVFQRGYAKTDFVLLVKGNPFKLKLTYSQGYSVTLNNNVGGLVLYIEEFGDYTLWTCRLTPQKYNMYTVSQTGANSQTSSFDLISFSNSTDKIKSVDCDKFVFDGESISFNVKTDMAIEALRVIENGEVIKTVSASSGENKLDFTPNATAEHNYVLQYQINGCWLSVGEYPVLVRDKAINLIKGDVDINRKINSTDALLVLQHSTAIVVLNENQIKCADVENDGIVNSTDALKILLYSTGNIENF